MRKLSENNRGNVQIVLMAIVAAIVLAVSIIIVYSIIAGIDYDSLNRGMGWNGTAGYTTGPGGCKPVTNASGALMTNLATFYSVSPIYIVVLAAIGIISAIMMVMVTRKEQ